MNIRSLTAVLAGSAFLFPGTAFAKNDAPELTHCEESIGTIALVDGDVTGWSKYGLGSPRELVNTLALESGCFTPHDPSSGSAARFLVTAVAGDQEEVDKSIEMGKAAASEALWRSGAAGSVVSKVPFGGTALGMFGGLGGKKKTIAAGLRFVSPATGTTLASGSGAVKKSTISFSRSGWASGAASAAGYAGSKDGRMLTEAFVIAFNSVIGQRAALDNAPASANALAEENAIVAVNSKLLASPAANASTVRDLRAGTELVPTGNREGLFIEVTDNYGTKGWVSVEDLK